jgi:hypothetical protein
MNPAPESESGSKASAVDKKIFTLCLDTKTRLNTKASYTGAVMWAFTGVGMQKEKVRGL